VDEPYRLFTSRSEFRLTVRQDNALRRLSPMADALGLLDAAERAEVARRLADEDAAQLLARETSISPAQAVAVLDAVGERTPAQTVRVAELARRPAAPLAGLLAAAGVGAGLDPEALVTAELELKYAGYFARERQAAERLARLKDFALAEELPYAAFLSLSTEARQKLAAVRPDTLAQAARIPGLTPNDLQNLVVEVERWRRGRPRATPSAVVES
jgi:tRNA uridine 5-carboxymethylaminomethyl modification enzyme